MSKCKVIENKFFVEITGLTDKERKILEFWKELGANEVWVDSNSIEFEGLCNDLEITMGNLYFNKNSIFSELVPDKTMSYNYNIDDLLKGGK